MLALEADSAGISEAVVAATSSLSDPSVIVGIVTAGLFLCVLIAQIFATRATFRAANAAKGAIELARYEPDLRLAPFISVPDLEVIVVTNDSGRILARRSPQTGEVSLKEAESRGDPASLIYRFEIKNSGPIAAIDTGHGVGKSFERDAALNAMRAVTGHSGTLVPPASSITHDIGIPLQVVNTFGENQDTPYYVAFSVVYKDHNGCGFLVEVEWELTGTFITKLRHSAPEPYTGEAIPG